MLLLHFREKETQLIKLKRLTVAGFTNPINFINLFNINPTFIYIFNTRFWQGLPLPNNLKQVI